jgi:hypothetical protein
MRAGDWEAGWRESDRVPSELVWNGTPFDGRRVRVRCLHGLGDTIQFMRFVPFVVERAANVDFLVQPALLELLRGAPGLGDVSNAWTDDPPPCDFEIEVMELAYAMRVDAANVPAPYPHLAAQVRGRPPVPLHEDGNLRVGLCWASSAWDASRSVPLAGFEQLVRTPGVTFYSLQQEDAARDPLVAELGIVPLSARTRAIADAAAAMLQMDLVMSIDAMPAHLALTQARRRLALDGRPRRHTVVSDDAPFPPTVARGLARHARRGGAGAQARSGRRAPLTHFTFDQPSPRSTTLTDAQSTSKRSRSLSDIARCVAIRALITSACETTATVADGFACRSRSAPSITRWRTFAKGSPPGGAAVARRSHQSRHPGESAFSSASVRPVHSPKSISSNSGAGCAASCSRWPMMAAVSRARCCGLL